MATNSSPTTPLTLTEFGDSRLSRKLHPDPDQLYDVACLYALCAGADRTGPDTARLAKECADEALTLLQHAVAKGYQNAAHMKQNRDLAALRQRPDFQKLLAELEAKK